MNKIKIIKKNDEYSSEYQIGDTFKIEGTWYGGVHIIGKTGAPVSLDKDEYIYLDADPENKAASASVIFHPESSASTQTSTVIPEAQSALTLSADTRKNDTEPLREIHVGDIVRHFKREWVSEESTKYLYKVLAFAEHTETGEKLVVYQAMYAPFKICARPYDMFMSEVDREKYPESTQEYRFEIADVPAVSIEGGARRTEQVECQAEAGGLDPLVIEFLDADSYEERLNILAALHYRITDDMINTMAIAIDVEVREGELEERYSELRNCLLLYDKFECNRLR